MAETMKQYDIVADYGKVVERVVAKDARQALCIYLSNHEEFEDMMLWKSAYNGTWCLAPYDDEGNYMYARLYDANAERIMGLMEHLDQFCVPDCSACCLVEQSPCPLVSLHNQLAAFLKK